MKKFNYLILIVSALAGMIAFNSCNKEKGIDDDPFADNDVYFEIDPTGTIQCRADDPDLLDEVFGEEGANADEEMAELRKLYLEQVKEREAELTEKYKEDLDGANSCVPGYTSYKFYYKSKDLYGNDVTLSGRVAWGTYWLLKWRNADPDNIYLLEHYTITDNSECPSENGKTDMVMVTGDNLLVMPDYLGYGITKERLHPYLNHDIAVQNSIDALEAAVAVWKKYGSGEMEDDWRMYVLGASQGASNALAVHKYLDTHEDIANKWRFDYSYCCCGAYDPELTMNTYYEWGKTAYVGAIPMTIKSMLASYPDIMKGFKEEDFYSEKYLKVKDQIDEALDKKKTNTTDLNHLIKRLLCGNEDQIPTLEDMLSKAALDKNSDLCKAFFQCLKKNELLTGWTPKHDIHLYATDKDEIVPYANTLAAKAAFGNKVKMSDGQPCSTSHVLTCERYYSSLATGWW